MRAREPRGPPRAPALPSTGLRAGAHQAAAVRTCSRNPEQLRAAMREARTPRREGAAGWGPSWQQSAPFEEERGRAAAQ